MGWSGGTHLSAAQIASLELDGLPSTKRGVHIVAEREGWSWRSRTGAGGGREYAVNDLPARARRDLASRWVQSTPTTIRPAGRPKGSDFFSTHPDVGAAVEAILAEQSIAAPRIMELLKTTFAELPSLRTLRRHIALIEQSKPALLAMMRDPDAYKSKYRVALGRADGGVTRAHQVWELDTTKADVMTKGGRKMVLGVIDRWSRRARFMVAESESGLSVRRLLIDTIRAWGVMPEAVATDNGSGYVNQSVTSALETLGIEHLICAPGSPEKKPFVERLFGTFMRDRAELLAGYAGHNVADAQRLRQREKKRTGRAVIVPVIDGDELQRVLDAWVDGVYHQRHHSSLGMTPMQRWMSSPKRAAAAPSEDVLKVALSALVGSFVVGKRGIQWKRGRYWSPHLPAYVGRQVIVRRDEEDLGALFVFDEDGHFIDTAVNHERAGLSEEAFTREARRQQSEYMRLAREDMKKNMRGFSFEKARDDLLRQDAEQAGKLAALPLPTEQRLTQAIESIAAVAAPVLPSQPKLDEAVRRTRTVKAETAADRIARADALILAADRGDAVDAEELRKARLYATSSEYRAEKLTQAAFQPRRSNQTPSRLSQAG
jgi:transposase InsO family protein